MLTKKDILKEIHELMRQRRISNTNLAERMDVSPAQANNMVKGHVGVSDEMIGRICKALDIEYKVERCLIY